MQILSVVVAGCSLRSKKTASEQFSGEEGEGKGCSNKWDHGRVLGVLFADVPNDPNKI